MRPAGYMAKKVVRRPDWLQADSVEDVYSVSGCISRHLFTADQIRRATLGEPGACMTCPVIISDQAARSGCRVCSWFTKFSLRAAIDVNSWNNTHRVFPPAGRTT